MNQDQVLANAFQRALEEAYFAEKLSTRVHGRAARKARSVALRRAMERQREESFSRLTRLNRVFGLIGKSARARACGPMNGTAREMMEYLDAAGHADGADAALISWAQQIDAYCMGRYGFLKDWSRKLDLPAAEEAIDETWDELTQATDTLARIADDLYFRDMSAPVVARPRAPACTGAKRFM